MTAVGTPVEHAAHTAPAHRPDVVASRDEVEDAAATARRRAAAAGVVDAPWPPTVGLAPRQLERSARADVPAAAARRDAAVRDVDDRSTPPVALQPAEVRRSARDNVPMLVTTPSGDRHGHLEDLRTLLHAGDLLVVNDSPTLAAALEVAPAPTHGRTTPSGRDTGRTSGQRLLVHVAGPARHDTGRGDTGVDDTGVDDTEVRDTGVDQNGVLVEVRRPDGAGTQALATPPAAAFDADRGLVVVGQDDLRVRLLAPWPASAEPTEGGSRLWTAVVERAHRSGGRRRGHGARPGPRSRAGIEQARAEDGGSEPWQRLPTTAVWSLLAAHGHPIRYARDVVPLPVRDLQTVFAAPVGTRAPIAGAVGSAEMPSAGRPFTPRLVGALGMAGIRFATVTLHCGISSQELGEPPLPEACRVPQATLDAITRARAAGGRVVAVGTTVVRALATAEAHGGPFTGMTDVVVTPDHRPALVDGLLSGFHEPEASHRDLLAAIIGQPVLNRAYDAAASGPYLWHELGDVHLLFSGRTARRSSRGG